ncbi:hypothetical protein BT63DRAFT_179435 [Microthyrium microscopicum]|uniref:CID domain-containing protein n=1 Tax=Microthyrium microscopicum TaxID=703497 RepID=A0A6A6UHV9_9PEZI|nr:hypothetical protein BT63DRAFT_179435 [Microthyrium microscopicum]
MAIPIHPAVQELEKMLQNLTSLKPPGVNKKSVEAATKICMDPQNITVEPQLVSALVAQFQKNPETHKLGVLYIIDSIMRQWVVTGASHAGGVRKMTDSLPSLMNDFIPVVPEGQKDRLLKLFDIWTSSSTFPTPMLAEFKRRLNNPAQQPSYAAAQPPAAMPSDPASLLAALAAPPAQPQQPQPVPQPQMAQQPPQSNFLSAFSSLTQPQAPSQPQNVQQFVPNYPQEVPIHMRQAPVPVPQQQPPVAPPAPVNAPAANPLAQLGQLGQLAALLPALQAPGGVQDPAALMQQIQLLAQLQQQYGQDGVMQVVQALQQQAAAQQPTYPPAQVAQQQPVAYPTNGGHLNGHGYGNQDTGPGARDRSRSPDWKQRNRYSPPARRDSPTYGNYDPNAPGGGQDDRGGRRGRQQRGGMGGRNEFRQRSPQPVSRDSPVPHSSAPKPVGFDNKLPPGSVKVLSRTLFVGGVKTSETDLKTFFRQFGTVQSCIVNHEKRHAFLKLVTHADAMATRQAIWNLPEPEYRSLFERVNWAVGFGPTHCADYNVGESTIPIDLLTDADRKWMLNAEFGGTGGKNIVPGMIVEEPDIEIGAGPSSKAIHRRGQGGNQGRGGNYFGRRGGNANHAANDSGHQRPPRNQRAEHVNVPDHVGPPPAVPTFGAPIPGFPFNLR